ncbi:response regulator [Lunatibacter salilacus]|uniref:response regulator n=1 Tax=Lunatibacter salilacus TaxID=2483804 RepID=UPI00131BB253|nr:response regulator [Lunatibacter salilacus]
MRKDKELYNILVIEDNLGDYILVRDFLEEMILTPNIIQAGDFKGALSKLKDDSHRFNAVFLDLSLPDKSGEDLIKSIILLANERPVIVLTGYTDASFAIKSLALGASDYLLKDDLTAITLYKSLTYNIERNKNLLKLKESELRYSDLFQLSPQPMWVYDVETHYCLDVNKAAISNYGYTHTEFLSMTIWDIRQKDGVDMEQTVQDTTNLETPFFQGLFKHRKKSGEIIDVDIRSNTIFFNGRKATVVLANDVTEKLRHTQIIEDQNKRLKEIAWTQSHIVRAPLSRMLGLIDLIKNNIIPSEEFDEFLGHLENSALEIDVIIRKIVRKTEELGMNEKSEQEKSENLRGNT